MSFVFSPPRYQNSHKSYRIPRLGLVSGKESLVRLTLMYFRSRAVTQYRGDGQRFLIVKTFQTIMPKLTTACNTYARLNRFVSNIIKVYNKIIGTHI